MKKNNLEILKDYVNKNKYVISERTLNDLEADFELKFNHESTKIEGNTLTLNEVKTILIDGISIGGKQLREIYEVTNNSKAYKHIKNMVEKKEKITEEKIKDIHAIVVENIFPGGIYRRDNVRILGASFIPPVWEDVRNQMKFFIEDLNNKSSECIEKSAWIHAEFIRIHPFLDGNGRTARLLLNYSLINEGYLPITIKAENRVSYYDALDKYGKNKDLELFYKFVYDLEEKRLLEYKNEIDLVKNRDLER